MTDRLLFLHGFTQTSACWGTLPGLLAGRAHRSTLLVDLPGHGTAGPACSLWETADRLSVTIGASAPRPGGAPESPTAGIDDPVEDAVVQLTPAVDVIGYSLGGRAALHLALAHPQLVRSLVLIGATAGIADPQAQAERRAADESRAQAIERDGVDAFVADWTAMEMFAGIPEPLRCLEARGTNTVEGLAGSLRCAGTGAQDNLWPRLGEIGCPTLVLAGELDEKFTEIGGRLASDIPHATFRSVPGAGHAAHLEQPGATAALIAPWLAALSPAGQPGQAGA